MQSGVQSLLYFRVNLFKKMFLGSDVARKFEPLCQILKYYCRSLGSSVSLPSLLST